MDAPGLGRHSGKWQRAGHPSDAQVERLAEATEQAARDGDPSASGLARQLADAIRELLAERRREAPASDSAGATAVGQRAPGRLPGCACDVPGAARSSAGKSALRSVSAAAS